VRGFGDINVMVIHHSASPRNITTQQIRHWHTKGRGWSDIGYHYVIENEGEVVFGRSISRIGAHCRGHNRDSIGVCVVGDNTKTEHQWSMTQIASLQDLVYGIKLVFPKVIVKGHRDLANTLCPGVDVQQLLNEV
jgi:N-acetyl-anhydromuramyl-L-alanine amidase AmpD